MADMHRGSQAIQHADGLPACDRRHPFPPRGPHLC